MILSRQQRVVPVSEGQLRVLLVGMAPVAERPGGGNRYLEDLRHALTRLGAKNHTLLLSGQSCDLPGVTVVGNPDRAVWWRVLAFARQIARQADDADVLNTHFALYGMAASLSRRGRRLPLVVHFQGPWAEESAVAGRARWAALRMKLAVETYHYRRADELITLSQQFADILIKDYGVQPGRVSVIAPGVDLEAFRPGASVVARRQLGLPEDCFIAVAVRRLTARMGLEQLIEAWSVVPTGALLVLAGEGDEHARLEQLISSLGLSERVRLLGRIADVDLPRLYRAANVSVVPTLALEGFGLVVLESLACGTPVIASNTGGMAEVLPDLSPDCLVPPGDVHALAARLSRAAARPQDEPKAETCRHFAEGFSWDSKAQEVLEIFQRAAVRTRRTSATVRPGRRSPTPTSSETLLAVETARTQFLPSWLRRS